MLQVRNEFNDGHNLVIWVVGGGAGGSQSVSKLDNSYKENKPNTRIAVLQCCS